MNEWANMLLQIMGVLSARMLILTPGGRVMAVTESCLKQVLGRERADVFNQPLPVALGFAGNQGSNKDLEAVLAVENALDGPGPWLGQLRLPDKDGSFWQVKVLPLRNAGEVLEGAAVVFEKPETTPAKVEEEMRLQNQAARARDVVHMAKNCLLSIEGALQVVSKKCELNNMHIDSLQLVREELAESVDIFNDFLQEGNLQSEVACFSCNQIVRTVVRTQRARFTMKQIDLQTDLAEDLPKIFMDKQRIKQVLMCCLDNSVDAIVQKDQPGGWVKISTSLDSAQGMVRLLVEDNGIGLTPEQLECFFKPYYTTKPNGSGLGACVCRSIVRLHGGSMWVKGQPGEGCCVGIEIPVENQLLFNRNDLYAEIAYLGI